MARLTAAQRRAMPQSEFAGPHKSYPVNDPAHARLAKALVGKYDPKIEKRVDAKANKELGKKR